jgi:hypothetical protein
LEKDKNIMTTWHATTTNKGSAHEQGLIIDDNGRNVAVSYDVANAELIATAPELLAALEYMLQADNDICENVGTKSDQAMSRIAAIDAARNAIARAKGQ